VCGFLNLRERRLVPDAAEYQRSVTKIPKPVLTAPTLDLEPKSNKSNAEARRF
jgi:hypothetical protein